MNETIKVFTKKSIIQAFREIQQHPELQAEGKNDSHNLVYKKHYPLLTVLSVANEFLNGAGLSLNDFDNLQEEVFEHLQELGFHIVPRPLSFHRQLQNFLLMADGKGKFKASDFDDQFAGLDVRVSYGYTGQNKIPWILFLGEGQNPRNGIFPGYIYFRQNKKLILEYGISESRMPLNKWNLPPDAITINEYFSRQGLSWENKYGTSFVYKVYDVENLPLAEKLDSDLNELIAIYKQVLVNPEAKKTMKARKLIPSFRKAVFKSGLIFNERLIARFIAALLAKPFVILTGLSGAGKTKLAQAFVQWICHDKNQYRIVPVGADWTNREPLLGFPNALEKGKYIKPDTGVLDLILEASKPENQNRPYFLILDEMNLSHVERYFADFLSAMESRDAISLRPEADCWESSLVPAEINLPENLFVIGTVNIDETTYMFSPKVLDRASVIEFRISHAGMQEFFLHHKPVNGKALKGAGTDAAKLFVDLAKEKNYSLESKEEMAEILLRLFTALQDIGAEFGYRSGAEIMRFAAVVNVLELDWSFDEIMDVAVMQKLLPKVHGSRRNLPAVLEKIAALCYVNEADVSGFKNLKTPIDYGQKEKIRYPISLEKLRRMYKRVFENGFASYA